MNRTAIVVSFYNSSDNELLRITPTIKGIENDKILYPDPIYEQTVFTQVLLPVNPASDMMSFSIQNGDDPADIIIFHYTRHPRLVSPECGCATFAEILSVDIEIQDDIERTNIIERWEFVNPKVTTVSYRQGIFNAENIRIYY